MGRSWLVAGMLMACVVMSVQAADGSVQPQQKQMKPSAVRQQQRAEKKDFLKEMKNMSPEERQAALQKREKDMEEKREAQFQDSVKQLKERLTRSAKLSAAQRDALVSFVVKIHDDEKAFREKQRADRVAMLDKVKNDASLSDDQKSETMKALAQVMRMSAGSARSGSLKAMKKAK